jgi:hypothetical protein
MFVTREDGEYLGPRLDKMIWTTLGVGLGSITEKNAAEFYARAKINDLIWDIPKAHRVSLEDVRQHIGLKTNVSDETRAQWLRRIVGGKADDFVREFDRDLIEVKEAA